MNKEDEIIELLREIRDLQKASLERYREISEKVVKQNEADCEGTKEFREEARRVFRGEGIGYRVFVWAIIAVVVFEILRSVGDRIMRSEERRVGKECRL